MNINKIHTKNKKNEFSNIRTKSKPVKDNNSEEFWKDCLVEKIENKQLSTMQDSKENGSLLSSLKSINNSGINFSQNNINNSKYLPRKFGSNHEIKDANLNLEKQYSNLICNLSEDAINFKSITKDLIKDKSQTERYNSANSSQDSVITFTEKKKKVNRSMENNKERIINSSLMDIYEEEEKHRRKKNEDLKKNLNNLYLNSQKKKEKTKLKILENEKIKLQKELEICTFKPKINDYTKLNKKTLNINLYERTKIWKQHNIEKNKKIKKQENDSKLNECSFQPTINHKTLNASITEATTIKDKDTLRYINRINNAKKFKEEKMAKLCPDVNSRYNKLFKKNSNIGVVNLITDNNLNSQYCTLNTNKNKLDYVNCRKKLNEELNSLVLTKNDEGDK